MNYSTYANVYCLSQDAVVIIIYRNKMENVFDIATIAKIDAFLLRK